MVAGLSLEDPLGLWVPPHEVAPVVAAPKTAFAVAMAVCDGDWLLRHFLFKRCPWVLTAPMSLKARMAALSRYNTTASFAHGHHTLLTPKKLSALISWLVTNAESL